MAEGGDKIRSFCTCIAGSFRQDYLGTMTGTVRCWNLVRKCLCSFQAAAEEEEAKGVGAGRGNSEVAPVAAEAMAEAVKVDTWHTPCTCIECNDPHPVATCLGTMQGTPRMICH